MCLFVLVHAVLSQLLHIFFKNTLSRTGVDSSVFHSTLVKKAQVCFLSFSQSILSFWSSGPCWCTHHFMIFLHKFFFFFFFKAIRALKFTQARVANFYFVQTQTHMLMAHTHTCTLFRQKTNYWFIDLVRLYKWKSRTGGCKSSAYVM